MKSASTRLLVQLVLQLHEELVDHAHDDCRSSSERKRMIASSRLRNSGVNMRLISAISSPASRVFVKPIDGRLPIASAPAFVVMMMMTLRKSALRPLLSVSVPWSMTCSRMLKMSGCAFSISSSSSTQWGCLRDGLGQQAALVEARRIPAARRSGGDTA